MVEKRQKFKESINGKMQVKRKEKAKKRKDNVKEKGIDMRL